MVIYMRRAQTQTGTKLYRYKNFGSRHGTGYPASRVSFDLPRRRRLCSQGRDRDKMLGQFHETGTNSKIADFRAT